MKIYPAFALQELGITDWSMEGSPTSEAEFLSMFKKRLSDGSFTNDSSQFGVTWSQVKTKLDEMNTAEPYKLLREERDRRLQATDWRASSDLTLSGDWKAHRQDLRDLPAQQTPKLNSDDELDFTSISWPPEPSS